MQFNQDKTVRMLRPVLAQDRRYRLSVGQGEAFGYKHLWRVAEFIAQMLRPYTKEISEEVQIFEGDRTVAKLIGELQPRCKPRQPGSAIGTLTIVSEDETHLEDFI